MPLFYPCGRHVRRRVLEHVFDALNELGALPTEVIPAAHDAADEGRVAAARPRRRSAVDGVRPALLHSSAPVLLCVEYNVATAPSVSSWRECEVRRALIFQEHRGTRRPPVCPLGTAYRRLLGVLAHGVVANTDAAYAELV